MRIGTQLNRPGLYFKSDPDTDIEDTEDQRALAQIAAERWIGYRDIYQPAENRFIEESRTYDRESRQRQFTQQAQAGARDSFTQAIQSDVAGMTAAGINPQSGQFQSAIADGTTDMATVEASNTTKTQQAIQDQKVRGLQNVVAMGMGQSGEAIAGLSDTAAASAQDASDRAINRHNSQSARNQAIGTAVGMGSRAAIEYGDQRRAI